jgi:hypothetical protein
LDCVLHRPPRVHLFDVLVVNPGTLVGGAGNDTFVFNAAPQAQSTIADFTHGQDLLQISCGGRGHARPCSTDCLAPGPRRLIPVGRTGRCPAFAQD